MWRKKDFLNQQKTILKYFEKNGVSYETISEFAALSGVPIVVICEFIKEETPEYTEMCDAKIAQIKEFFGIKDGN